MDTDFFQLQALPADMFQGQYNYGLVLLSYLVAIFASYIALDFTGRLRDLNNTKTSTYLWLAGGALAMGSGIWSMHFIGMLSFSIPGLTLRYDLYWTILSLLVAIAASTFALFLLKKTIINVVHIIAGGVVLGLAIASMHYTGMEAMFISLDIRYLPGLFLLSILVAIAASEAALWMALKSNIIILRFRTRIKIVSSLIMGLGICGMHYIGMAASVFTPLCYTSSNTQIALDQTFLSIIIAAVTFIILCIAFLSSVYKESINQDQLARARQAGMAEISASVLHNVGNVLNSINITAETILKKNHDSHVTDLQKLCALLNEHQAHLGEFFTQDPRGPKALYFLNELAKYWHEDYQWTNTEVNNLLKNIQNIKNIINTHQDLSKIMGTEQPNAIPELLDEALMLAGLESPKDITVIKHYGKMGTTVVDIVKLMQILVNLLRNAKDALIASSNTNKTLTVQTELINNKMILIKISDNGVGILPGNMHKIFNYGFTTKQSGHGFGLHASALSINELGGEIHVTSEGLGKGATFSLTLPYIHPAG